MGKSGWEKVLTRRGETFSDMSTLSSEEVAKGLAEEDAYANKDYKSVTEGGDTLYIRTNIPRVKKRIALEKEYTKRRNRNPHSGHIRKSYYKERNKIRRANNLKPIPTPKKYSYGGRVAKRSAEKS